MIVFFVYNILIFNYKDTKNYRDYQLFKRISYPELRLIDDRGKNGTSEFAGEWIEFGSEKFPDWNSVLVYLMNVEQ